MVLCPKKITTATNKTVTLLAFTRPFGPLPTFNKIPLDYFPATLYNITRNILTEKEREIRTTSRQKKKFKGEGKMISRIKSFSFYGSLGGSILYLLVMLISSFPYFNISNGWFKFYFILFVVLGCITVLFCSVNKSKNYMQTISRFLMLVLFYILIYVIGGYSGLVRLIYSFLDVTESFTDNISGMLVLSYSLIVFVLCGVLLLVSGLIKMIIPISGRSKDRKENTGDGSVC